MSDPGPRGAGEARAGGGTHAEEGEIRLRREAMLEPVIEALEGIEGAWWLLGIAAVVGVVKGFRPLVKGGLKGYMAARDGVARLSAGVQQGLTGLYEEAVQDV